MARFVKVSIVGDKNLAMSSRRDTRFNSASFQYPPKFVAVISPVSDQNHRFRHGSQHQPGIDMIG
jgi:hypothetical protein